MLAMHNVRLYIQNRSAETRRRQQRRQQQQRQQRHCRKGGKQGRGLVDLGAATGNVNVNVGLVCVCVAASLLQHLFITNRWANVAYEQRAA